MTISYSCDFLFWPLLKIMRVYEWGRLLAATKSDDYGWSLLATTKSHDYGWGLFLVANNKI